MQTISGNLGSLSDFYWIIHLQTNIFLVAYHYSVHWLLTFVWWSKQSFLTCLSERLDRSTAMSNAAELGVLFMTLFIILFLFYTYLQKRMKHQEPIFSYYNHCSAQLRLQTLCKYIIKNKKFMTININIYQNFAKKLKCESSLYLLIISN